MHNAPSVSYPVGRCAFQRWLYTFFTVATSSVLLTWSLSQGFSWPWCVAALASALGVCMGWRASQHAGTLTWDGQVWCLHGQSRASEDALGQVQVSLDMQRALLLRFQPVSETLHAKSVWLWLGAEVAGTHWQDLRRAVYQRANID